MIRFLYHPGFEKELGKMVKKVRTIKESFGALSVSAHLVCGAGSESGFSLYEQSC